MYPCSVLVLAVSLFSVVASRPVNSPLREDYDYIVVGGGPSGLTVANRLSEDPDITVLVLEAGDISDDSETNLVPIRVGLNIFTSLNWQLSTAPQTYLDGGTRYYPLGKGLGGGTIINGMLWNRGGQDDYNAWRELGNPGWGWDDMLPYFIKSERLTPYRDIAPAKNVNKFGVHFNPPFHGYDGSVNVSYSRYIYPASENFFRGLNETNRGIRSPVWDPNAARFVGGSFLPVNLDPLNQTRCTARHAHYDPVADRPNLDVSTGQHVTQLIFEDTGCSNPAASMARDSQVDTNQNVAHSGPDEVFGMEWPDVPTQKAKRQEPTSDQSTSLKRIIGIQYARSSSSPRKQMVARREIILAAGATHTPGILQLSGIGSPSLLKSLNITTQIPLLGVGNNLQDHALVETMYPYANDTGITLPSQLNNVTIDAAARAEYYANRTGPYTAGPPDGVAFLSLTQLSDRASAILTAANISDTTRHLPPGTHPHLQRGYAAQHRLLLSALGNSSRAATELLNNNAGQLVVSNMRPFSRGSVTPRSSDPFDPPIIDPRYGADPVDLAVLREALLFNRLLLSTPSMRQLRATQEFPAADLNDEQLLEYVKKNVGTEYHSSGTAAMLPRHLGGVVDSKLRVYGTANLRVVDTSIYPLLPASHLQAVCFAVAEKAADIVKADLDYTGKPAGAQMGPVGGCGGGGGEGSSATGSTESAAATHGVGPLMSVQGFSSAPTSSSTTSSVTSSTTAVSTASLAFPAPAYSVPASLTEGHPVVSATPVVQTD